MIPGCCRDGPADSFNTEQPELTPDKTRHPILHWTLWGEARDLQAAGSRRYHGENELMVFQHDCSSISLSVNTVPLMLTDIWLENTQTMNRSITNCFVGVLC